MIERGSAERKKGARAAISTESVGIFGKKRRKNDENRPFAETLRRRSRPKANRINPDGRSPRQFAGFATWSARRILENESKRFQRF